MAAKAEAWCELAERDGRRVARVGGRWTVFNLGMVRGAVDALTGNTALGAVDLSQLEDLDTSGAAHIVRLTRAGKLPMQGARDTHAKLIALVAKQQLEPEPVKHVPAMIGLLIDIASDVFAVLAQGKALLGFFGETLVSIVRALRSPRRFRPTSVVNLMEQVWLRAMPIVGVLQFLIGMVLAYQGIEQLRRFGADAFTVDMVGISVMREIGVLFTAIIVAGRSGSAFTAQIGTMKVNQEVDAMITLGLSPVEVLVVPRILALVLTMPLLVFFADIMGLLGGAVACVIYLDFTLAQFFERLRDVVANWHFWIGLIKAPVFAFVVAMVGCYEGLQVSGSAESVGAQTTKSVVESIFLVILLDAAFSILFLSIGI